MASSTKFPISLVERVYGDRMTQVVRQNNKTYMVLHDLAALAKVSGFYWSIWKYESSLFNNIAAKVEHPDIYFVFLAQKSTNINDIIYKLAIGSRSGFQADSSIESELHEDLESIEISHNKSFFTQSGMFLQADAFAREYHNSGRFPTIIIVDELARTGYDLAEFMYTFEQHIIAALEELSHNEISRRDVHNALIAAVRFHVYMCNEKPLLVNEDFRRIVRRQISANEEDQYKFAADIARDVTLSQETENTAYTPTLYLSDQKYNELVTRFESGNKWSRNEWYYRGTESDIWHRTICLDGDVKLYFAVRARHLTRFSKRALTAFVFWRGMERESLDSSVYLFRKFLRRESDGFRNFCKILDNNTDLRRGVQVNFLYSLLSLSLNLSFLREANVRSIPTDHDLEKICQSFGSVENLLPEYNAYMQMAWEESSFSAALFHFLENDLAFFATPFHARVSVHNDSKSNSQYLLNAENYLCERSLQEHETVFLRRKDSINYVSWSKFGNLAECGLDYYLNSFPDDYTSLDQKLGALLMLLQTGMTGMKKVTATLGDSTECAFLLTVGETVDIIHFQHLYRFIPALIAIEGLCKKRGLNSEREAGWFGRTLEQDGDETGLGELFTGFLQRIHRVGLSLKPYHEHNLLPLDKPDPKKQIRTVKEWSGKPWSENEMAEIMQLSQEEYVNWERRKQQYYKNKASIFLLRF